MEPITMELNIMEPNTVINVPKICTGYIYIIQTPLNPYIKIGLSTTCSAKLINRYITPYGGELTVYLFASTDVTLHEARVHWRMRDDYLTGELFRLDALDEAILAAELVTGSAREIITYKSTRNGPTNPDAIVNHKKREFVRPGIGYNFQKLGRDHDQIIMTAEITREDFDNMLVNYDAVNRYKMDRFMLRSIYEWAGDIDDKFMNAYGNIGAVNIYRNLKLVAKYSCAQKCIEKMGAYERPDELTELDKEHFRIRTALHLLEICGFNGPYDTKNVSNKFLQRLNVKFVKKIWDNIDMIRDIFGDNSFLAWERNTLSTYFIASMNIILKQVFGVKIGPIKRNGKPCERSSYTIHHEYYGKLFDISPTIDRPYIIINRDNVEDRIAENIEII